VRDKISARVGDGNVHRLSDFSRLLFSRVNNSASIR
jgi:hypothetical protein